MADWSAIETTLEEWVASITGLPVQWRHRPASFSFNNAGYALLSISARRSLGHDDLTYEYDDAAASGQEIIYAQSGQRQFTFQVQVRVSRQSVDVDAKHYTSLLRDSLDLPQRTTEVWASADIAFARVLAETDIDARLDGRELSVAQIDISVNASALAEDAPTTYISLVDDATLEAPEGSTKWTGDIPVGS